MRSEILRVALAMLERRLVEGTQGNVSARSGRQVLITPAGVPYEGMTPDDLVELGVAHPRHEPSSEWRVHDAIYAARPDVAAIVHTHSPSAVAFAATERDLSSEVRVARFAETGTADLGAYAVEALGDRSAVLLARHGVVGVGATLDEALAVCERVEALAAERLLP